MFLKTFICLSLDKTLKTLSLLPKMPFLILPTTKNPSRRITGYIFARVYIKCIFGSASSAASAVKRMRACSVAVVCFLAQTLGSEWRGETCSPQPLQLIRRDVSEADRREERALRSCKMQKEYDFITAL